MSKDPVQLSEKFTGMIAANSSGMMTFIIVTAVLAIVFIVEIAVASRAPLGYEDETGFHFAPDAKNPAEPAKLPEVAVCLNPT